MCKVRCSKTTLLGAVLCCLGLLECLRRVHEAQEDILMPSLNVSSAKIQKILLLAYARSGSSYTGELLSALPSDVLVQARTDLWSRVMRRQPLPMSLLATHPIDISRN